MFHEGILCCGNESMLQAYGMKKWKPDNNKSVYEKWIGTWRCMKRGANCGEQHE